MARFSRSLVTGALVASIALGCFSVRVASAFTIPQSQTQIARLRSQPTATNLLFLGPVSHPGVPSRGQSLSLHANINIWGQLQLKKKSKSARAAARQLMSIRSSRWMHKVRQLAVTLCAAAFLWFGAAGYSAPPAHASATVLTSIEKVLPSASLDQMVDRYVKDHMFDDDVYDPVESAYRETYDDMTSGDYPLQLKDITAGVLGKSAVVERKEGENKVMAVFIRASQVLTQFGLSEKVAQVILAVSAFAASFFSFVAVFGGISFFLKQGLKRELKARYGQDYR
jgi:hypothetical protein